MANEPFRIKMPVGEQSIEITSTKTPEELASDQAAIDKATEDARIAEETRIVKEKEDSTSKDTTETTELTEGTEVDFGDDIIGTIDKDGNAVDTSGKVIKTKTELEALVKANQQTPNTNEDYIKTIQERTNLIITDDAGKPIVYDNTVDGITKYTEDVYINGKTAGEREYEQRLLEQYPIIKDVITHLTLNGSIDGFAKQVDYKKITLSDTDEIQWTSLFIAAQTKKGISEEEATTYAKYLKEDGKLKEAATQSLKFLNDSKSKDEQIASQRIAQQRREEEEADRKYWNDIQQVVKTGKVKLGTEEYTIPKVMRVNENGKVVTKTPDDFWNYINVTKRYNIDGEIVELTAHQFDAMQEQSKRSVNDDVYEALQRFLKYDKSQILKAQLNTATAKQIIKLTSKSGTVGLGADNQGKSMKLVLPVPQSSK